MAPWPSLIKAAIKNYHSHAKNDAAKSSPHSGDSGDSGETSLQEQSVCSHLLAKAGNGRNNMLGKQEECAKLPQQGDSVGEDRGIDNSHHNNQFNRNDTDDESPLLESFPMKLHRMLEEAERDGNEDIVSFLPPGDVFAIHDPSRFQNEIMPKYFKTSFYSSFQRQLNLYGFSRVTEGSTKKGRFAHEFFIKGRPEIAAKIIRKRQYAARRRHHTPTASSTPNSNHHSSSSSSTDFLEGIQKLPAHPQAGLVVGPGGSSASFDSRPPVQTAMLENNHPSSIARLIRTASAPDMTEMATGSGQNLLFPGSATPTRFVPRSRAQSYPELSPPSALSSELSSLLQQQKGEEKRRIASGVHHRVIPPFPSSSVAAGLPRNHGDSHQAVEKEENASSLDGITLHLLENQLARRARLISMIANF